MLCYVIRPTPAQSLNGNPRPVSLFRKFPDALKIPARMPDAEAGVDKVGLLVVIK